MQHNFLNWTKAVVLMENCVDPVAYGAMALIHQGVMNCAGVQTLATKLTQLPAVPLDLVWFYGAVSFIVGHWNSENIEHCNLVVTKSGLPNLSPENFDNLSKFAVKLRGFPRTADVDDSFCVWLFAETVLLRDLLPSVLNGMVAKRLKHSENISFDEWAAAWEER